MTAVIAGTQFRGQFEARMKAIIDECKNDGNIILVIDEIHNIIGAGDAEHSMNAANILKPSLANGELQMIGTTTLKEYRKYIEKDTALERRFQPIIVEEPSVEDAISILQGIKQYYEDYHHVKISNDIIRQIVNMSEKYIHDRFLPDKAIDLIDEACSMIKTEMESMPTELDEISRKIMQLEIEETALSKETDEMSKQRLQDIQKEKAELKTKFDSMKAKWENEKQSIGKVQKLREEKESVKKGIKEGLEGLAGQIPGLIDVHVNINGLESSTADVMLDTTFESVDALKAYAVNPKHVAVADGKVRPYTAIRSCLDYEV